MTTTPLAGRIAGIAGILQNGRDLAAPRTFPIAVSRVDLTAQEVRGIEDLARGELTQEQRSSLLPLLARNENAIELLASLLKKVP